MGWRGVAVGLSASYAWVEGGQVRIHHEPGSRCHPVLRPGPNVRLWVNGELVSHARVILPGDEVTVEVSGEDQPPRLDHRVTPDGMHCFLSFKGGRMGRMRLMDQLPSRELTLVAVPDFSDPALGLSTADLVRYLREEVGIRAPIDEQAVNRLLTGLEAEVEVATGTPPGPTVDGWIEYLVPFSVERVQVSDEAAEPVDYLDLRRIPTVKAGTTLAVVIQASGARRGPMCTAEWWRPRNPRSRSSGRGRGCSSSGTAGRRWPCSRAVLPGRTTCSWSCLPTPLRGMWMWRRATSASTGMWWS